MPEAPDFESIARRMTIAGPDQLTIVEGVREVWNVSGAADREAGAQGWLLIETWRDKSVHHEGLALTHEAKDAFMRGEYEQGHSRTALPLKIWTADA